MTTPSRARRFRKRYAVALIAIAAEVVAGLIWWRHRRSRRDEDLSRDG